MDSAFLRWLFGKAPKKVEAAVEQSRRAGEKVREDSDTVARMLLDIDRHKLARVEGNEE